jgi:hypothetical protein
MRSGPDRRSQKFGAKAQSLTRSGSSETPKRYLVPSPAVHRAGRLMMGTMHDRDGFWTALERRICRELRGMNDNVLKQMWCDGIRGDIVRPEAGPAYMYGTI